MSGFRDALTGISRIALAVLLFYFAGEVVIRIYYFGLDAFSFKKMESIGPMGCKKEFWKSDGPRGLRPYARGFHKLKWVSINSDGFRDREYSVEKPEGTCRIIFLGDSALFGSGVDLEDTVPKLLERKLNETLDGKFEVLNFGVSGHNLRDEIALLNRKGLKYRPDLVLLLLSHNDVFF